MLISLLGFINPTLEIISSLEGPLNQKFSLELFVCIELWIPWESWDRGIFKAFPSKQEILQSSAIETFIPTNLGEPFVNPASQTFQITVLFRRLTPRLEITCQIPILHYCLVKYMISSTRKHLAKANMKTRLNKLQYKARILKSPLCIRFCCLWAISARDCLENNCFPPTFTNMLLSRLAV